MSRIDPPKPVAEPPRLSSARPELPGQVVLVLQGGGALGAYQMGVYRALHEAGIEPDWVIGTSIGAINAALIAGNPPERRLARMQEFWQRVAHSPLQRFLGSLPPFGGLAATWMTLMGGIAPFFRPNLMAMAGPYAPLSPEAVGYYSTEPLSRTLGELVDIGRLQGGEVRLTVGAANLRSGEMRYFDSRDERLELAHVMASGALPPAFPPVRIAGELYWDGGILSNTPVEAVFDDFPRRNALVFAVHLWNPSGGEPATLWEAMNRQKDLQYFSRALSHIERQRQLHKLRHVIKALAARLPDDLRREAEVEDLKSYGCTTRMHVVRLLAPSLSGEDHMKDIDFSPGGIAARAEAGYRDTLRVLETAPWACDVDPLEGFVLHQVAATG